MPTLVRDLLEVFLHRQTYINKRKKSDFLHQGLKLEINSNKFPKISKNRGNNNNNNNPYQVFRFVNKYA